MTKKTTVRFGDIDEAEEFAATSKRYMDALAQALNVEIKTIDLGIEISGDATNVERVCKLANLLLVLLKNGESPGYFEEMILDSCIKHKNFAGLDALSFGTLQMLRDIPWEEDDGWNSGGETDNRPDRPW